MKTLPLSVLFYEGPMARAYLEMISRAGFKVEAVIRPRDFGQEPACAHSATPATTPGMF